MICAYCGREATENASCSGCGAPVARDHSQSSRHDLTRMRIAAAKTNTEAMRYYLDEMGAMPSDYYRDPLVRQAVAAKMRARG